MNWPPASHCSPSCELHPAARRRLGAAQRLSLGASRRCARVRLIGYSNDSLKRKCEEQGEVHKQGRGGSVSVSSRPPHPSPLFVYFALFFTLPFQRIVGIAYCSHSDQDPIAVIDSSRPKGNSCLSERSQITSPGDVNHYPAMRQTSKCACYEVAA